MNPSDPGDFERLYRQHYGLVAYTLREFRVPPEDRDELIQEVFLRLHRDAAKVDPAKVKAFLVVTARNLLIDRHRKAKRRKTEATAEVEALPERSLWSDGDAAQRELEVAVCGQLIAELGATKEGAAFGLFYRDGLSLKEIAAKSDEPIGTIAARVSRARTKFKERLKETIEALR